MQTIFYESLLKNNFELVVVLESIDIMLILGNNLTDLKTTVDS